MQPLKQVITVDEDKCVNCHRCIAVCPVKYCNNGTGEHVDVNTDMCIACGQCLTACSHEARNFLDDFGLFMSDINQKTPMVAVVAPSVAANFPGHYLRFNTWLKSLGISAVFDVSFGAELTVQSYLHHIKTNKPDMVIAQPCPAIVTYIEIYLPELLPYLAPADSPMMHTMKMIREFYPRYKSHKMLVISPCIAKSREFSEVGIGDYNVTMDRIDEHIKNRNIDLSLFTESEFDNDPAERAVLFSTPGGLMRTAERYNPEITALTRKIEGPDVVYDYLDHLPHQLGKGYNPLLVDILNCHKGCNGGTGTPRKDDSQDELEYYIETRRMDVQKKYKTVKKSRRHLNRLEKTISKYWRPGLYDRKYINRSENNTNIIPTSQQIQELYLTMDKTTEEDIKNCSSCGYNTCEAMSVAIFNQLNKKENCHFFLEKNNVSSIQRKEEMISDIKTETAAITQALSVIDTNTKDLVQSINRQLELVNQASQAVENESGLIKTLALKMETKATEKLVSLTESGGVKIIGLSETMKEIGNISDKMKEIVKTIDEISNQTNILSINASIQSAHAGEYGKPFSVVAKEIKSLANTTAGHVEEIARFIHSTNVKLKDALHLSQQGGDSFSEIASEVDYVDQYLIEIGQNMDTMTQNSHSVFLAQNELRKLSIQVLQQSKDVQQNINHIQDSLIHLKDIS